MKKLTKRQEANLQKKNPIKVWWRSMPKDKKYDGGMAFRGIMIREKFFPYSSEEGGYLEDNSLRVGVAKDGAIMFSDDVSESFIYFYPDQLKLLSSLVDEAKKQRDGKRKK